MGHIKIQKKVQSIELTGHTDCVNSVAFSPDGTKLASGSRDITIIICDLKTYKTVHILKGHTD